MVWSQALSKCLAAVADRLGGLEDPVARDSFRTALDAIEPHPREGTGAAMPGRTDLPIPRHWSQALKGAAAIDPALGGALEALSSAFAWRQNPNYTRRPPSPEFLDGYAYAVIAGPGGLIPAEIALGVLVLAPGLLYPAHAHPAEEVYLVLDPMSRWWRDGEDWRQGLGGGAIHHRPALAHAMQAGSTPLCAVYLWRGALEVDAALVRQPETLGNQAFGSDH